MMEQKAPRGTRADQARFQILIGRRAPSIFADYLQGSLCQRPSSSTLAEFSLYIFPLPLPSRGSEPFRDRGECADFHLGIVGGEELRHCWPPLLLPLDTGVLMTFLWCELSPSQKDEKKKSSEAVLLFTNTHGFTIISFPFLVPENFKKVDAPSWRYS